MFVTTDETIISVRGCLISSLTSRLKVSFRWDIGILSPCGLRGVCIVAEYPKYHVISRGPFGSAQDKLRD